ncbi:MAG: TIGR04282 family arsenosugar biosynthesis glycosyltransferase [Betaproteobacteria bacterium]|nr:TIGR04282 family arsenosugar biosynthesis glycosyltransferase [Betaproteobacteria bacterium]MBI2960732.1 TIGR04282 family arsenosugar biosynthesis glycosyltransferase [Betaproteobacteria bacterium]
MAAGSATIAVFAKAPEPGKVKTRLIPALGAAAAAELQRRLVQRVLGAALEAGLGPVELWCTPDPDHPFFLDCARRYSVSLAAQGPGDLGERMLRAFDALLGKSARALLIGTDIPAMTACYLREADAALASGCDAVLGPAEDGGYVLIGLRRAAPQLFTGVRWGEAQVCAQTRVRLEQLALRYRELAPLWDVDRPEDLRRLAELEKDWGRGF